MIVEGDCMHGIRIVSKLPLGVVPSGSVGNTFVPSPSIGNTILPCLPIITEELVLQTQMGLPTKHTRCLYHSVKLR
jgi:hypothetical protein